MDVEVVLRWLVLREDGLVEHRARPEVCRRRTRRCDRGCSTPTGRRARRRGRCREAASCGRDSPGSASTSSVRSLTARSSSAPRTSSGWTESRQRASAGHVRGCQRNPRKSTRALYACSRLDGDAGVVARIAHDGARVRPRAEEDRGRAADRDRRRALLDREVRQPGVDPDHRGRGAEHVERVARRGRARFRDPERAHLGRGLVASDQSHVEPPSASPATSDLQRSTGHCFDGPSLSVTRSTDELSSGRGHAVSGIGRVKSAAMPKSAQIRPRMSLIESGPERVLELGRAPPPVSLERMITQVDEATVVVVAVERRFLHPAGQSGDAVGEPCLGSRTRDQPGLVAVVPAVRDQRLDRGQRDREVAQTEGNGRHIDATHAGIPPNHAVRAARTR